MMTNTNNTIANTFNNFNNGIILLSGGLDSAASLAVCIKHFKIGLALTFDYGQNAAQQEISSAKKIAEYYGIEHKVLKLDWMKSLYTAEIPLINSDMHPSEIGQELSDKVWIPNRNALFINIAAAFADSESNDFDVIIIGANREEAQNFPDNSQEFVQAANRCLEYSTKNKVKVFSPLIDFDKPDILKLAFENNAPLEYIYSCYQGTKVHCGQCESCLHLKHALEGFDKNTARKYIKMYFGE